MPKVSVIMAVHNGEPYLKAALDSISTQTFSDFEFIVVDDASSDNTWNILSSHADSRLIILRNTDNLGCTRSLNKALERTSGQYIARMDADDISLSCRFEKQVNFLEAHPEIGLLGTGFYRILSSGRRVGGPVRNPESDVDVRWAILLENPFCHPSVMFRGSVVEKNGLNYNQEFTTTQDYELWVRMLTYCKGGNLSEPLLLYRMHGKSISLKCREIQQRNSVCISSLAIRTLLPEMSMTEDTIRLLQKGFFGNDQFRFLPGVDRQSMANSYLELFYTFERVVGREKVSSVRRIVGLFTAYIVLHLPFPSNGIACLKKAILLYPTLVWAYPGFALKKLIRKIGRWVFLGCSRESVNGRLV